MHTHKNITNTSRSCKTQEQGKPPSPEVLLASFTCHCGKHSLRKIFLRDCALIHGRKASRGQSIPSEALAEILCLFTEFRPVPTHFTSTRRCASSMPYLHLQVTDHPSPEHSWRRGAADCMGEARRRVFERRRLGGWWAVAPSGGG